MPIKQNSGTDDFHLSPELKNLLVILETDYRHVKMFLVTNGHKLPEDVFFPMYGVWIEA